MVKLEQSDKKLKYLFDTFNEIVFCLIVSPPIERGENEWFVRFLVKFPDVIIDETYNYLKFIYACVSC